MKCIFMLLQPRVNTNGCVSGLTVTLKNCITVTEKHLDHRMNLFIQNVHVVTGNNSTVQRTSRIPRYCAQIITDPPACSTVGTKHSGQQASLGILHTQTWPYMENMDDSCDHTTYFQSPDIHVLWSLHHLCNLSVLFSVIGGLAIIALLWMLDLWSSWTVFVGTAFFTSRWISSSAVTYAALVLCFLDTILFNVQWSLSLSFGFWPLFLQANDVFPWFVYAIITLETAALHTPNKVAILVTDAPAECTPTVCPLWKPDKPPILQYFHTDCY